MMVAAKHISEGSWSARWGDHVIHIRERGTWWTVTVWRWTHGGGIQERMQLDYFDGFVNAQVAVAWACDVLVAHGASAFINGQKVNIADLLAFSPAPEIAS